MINNLLPMIFSVIAGVCLYTGFHHFFITIKSKRDRINLTFSIVCFLASVYIMFDLHTYKAETISFYVAMVKGQDTLHGLFQMAMLWFVAFYTGIIPGRFIFFLNVLWLGSIGINIIEPYGIAYSYIEEVGSITLFWGERIREIAGEPNSFLVYIYILIVLNYITYFYCAITTYRRGNRYQGRTIILALLVFIGFIVHDLTIVPLATNWFSLSEFGFMAFVILMSLNLSNTVIEAGRVKMALVESERKFRAVFNQSFQIIGVLDSNGHVLEINQTAIDFIGITQEDVKDRLLWETIPWSKYPEERKKIQDAVEKTEGGAFSRLETKISDLDGNEFIIDFTINPVKDDNGKVVLLIPEGRDITDQKYHEAWMKNSITEKEILLKELHHRVKNNMQIISSLLSLQSEGSESSELHEFVKDSYNRIKAMALVHEKIYQSDNFSEISILVYITDLINHYLSVYDIGNNITITSDIENIHLDINRAITCGLIINELVTNSIKHAFADDKTGAISISFKRKDDGSINLAVSDNGEGFPADLEIDNPKTLGIQLVNTLVKQLRGEIELVSGKGAFVKISFPA